MPMGIIRFNEVLDFPRRYPSVAVLLRGKKIFKYSEGKEKFKGEGEHCEEMSGTCST